MLTRTQFEGVLMAASEVPTTAAGADAPDVYSDSGGDVENDKEAIAALLEAAARLQQNPSLSSGGPEGSYTYEDPILAVAALWARKASEYDQNIVDAGVRGEDLRNTSLWSWMVTGVRAWLSRGDSAFVTLGGKTPTGPVSIDKGTVRIAVLGDAGYRGVAQDRVLRMIQERHGRNRFDAVVHLGDTYFAGSEEEMLKHFLVPFSPLKNDRVQVLTLCGNHDLYYGAAGYNAALSILGQPGRYFLIETPNWRVACLDTSLGAERILRGDAILDEGQLEWLNRVITAGDKRPLILMSHHYIISGWETPPESLRTQLRDIVKDKVFAWYWGHEHCCATYEKGSHGFYGACVGNGVFLEKWSKPEDPSKPTLSWYAKGSCECYDTGRKHYWPHGFLELQLEPGRLVENYHLENNESYSRTLSTNS